MNATRAPGSDAPPPVLLSAADTEPAPDPASDSGYVLTLYVASLTPHSVIAIQSVKEVCEKYLSGQYSLEVVDIYERPSLAKHDRILAAPTLIKRLPLPLRRLIGDMADEHRVLIGLDLRTRPETYEPQG